MTHFVALLALAPLLSQAGPHVVGLNAVQSGRDVVITVTLTSPAAPSAPVLLEQPLRLYVDVPGARPGSQRQLDVKAGPVALVRVALNRPSPPVTRIVIELTAKAAWRIERGQSGREFRLILSAAEGQTPPAPAAAAVTPPALRGTVLYAPATTTAVDRREQIRTELFAMSGAIEAMRAWTGPSDAELATLIAAVEVLSSNARGMQMTGSASDIALVAAIDGVSAAAAARAQALADGTQQSRANAIAAANGARLLLQHAQGVKRQ